MGRHLAIVNPAAGGGRSGREAAGAVERLRRAGLHVDVRRTARAGDATAIAREAYRAGVRDFIAGGGDGTAFEIVNGLFPLASDRPEDRPSVGFLPMGTGNSFLRDFTERGSEYALAALASGRKRSCDVLRLTHGTGDLYYINILSLGFAADVCVTRNERFGSLGEAGYVLGVLRELTGLRPRPLPMRVDGAAEFRDPVTFVSVSNSRFTGGKMMMAPAADPTDGLADLIVVGPMGRWSLLRAFPRIFRGTHVDLPSVSATRARSIDFDLPDPVNVMIDGETRRLTPKRIEVLKGAIDAYA
jgi:YegS/Rv2252/BmrU family lipid kinase